MRVLLGSMAACERRAERAESVSSDNDTRHMLLLAVAGVDAGAAAASATATAY